MAKSLKQRGRGSQGRWDDALKGDYFTIPPKPARTRLYDKLAEVHQHYVKFYSEKRKGETGFFELCLNWDPVADDGNGAAVEGGCPYCEMGERASEYHYAYLIPRAAQKKGILTVHPLRMTSKLAGDVGMLSDVVYNDSEKLPQGWEEEDPPEATHRKYGFDVFFRMEEKNSKTEYVASQGDIAPLTKEERQAFEEYIAEGKDIALLAKKGMKPRAMMLQDIERLGIGGTKDRGGKSGGGSRKPQRDYDGYDDDVPADGEEERRPARASGKANGKPSSRRGDDDDEAPAPAARRRNLPWEDDDEAPAGKGGRAARAAASDDDDDEGPSRSYATPDDDDAPDADDAEA